MKTNNIYQYLFLVLIFFSALIFAQENVYNDSPKAAESSSETSLSESDDEKNIDSAGSFDPTWKEIFTHDIHNKVIHFPIGFSIAAFILTLIGFRENRFEVGIKWLVTLAGLIAIIAFFSGEAQEESFEGTAKEWVVEVHQTFGLVSLFIIWIWAVFLYLKPLKKYAWIVGAALTIIILITATYGGMLAHG